MTKIQINKTVSNLGTGKKIIIGISLLVVLVASLILATTSQAAFLLVDEHGNLVWQVLSRASDDGDEGRSGSSSSSSVSPAVSPQPDDDEDAAETRIEVRTTNRGPGKATGTEVRIRTDEKRVRLEVSTPSGQTSMDVTDVDEDIIRIRERTEDQEIRIRARNGRLEIRQRGVGALTHFPIAVNPQTNELTVTTPSGIRVVAILPSVAVANILQSNIMDRILAAQGAVPSPEPTETPEPEEDEEATEAAELEEEIETDQEVELVEEDGALAFKIRGVKDTRFLNLFSVQAPITAFVSTQTGEVLSLDRPWFLNLFGFLFSQ